MNMSEFNKILARIQKEEIDVHGEIIDFPAGNANQFLWDFERLLLKYATFRGCANNGKNVSKFKNQVNKNNGTRWGKLKWDAVDIFYSAHSNRKHRISGYRKDVLAEMLIFLADKKVSADQYQDGFTFAQAADKFMDLMKKNNVPQYGWNRAESYLFVLNCVVKDRRRAYTLKMDETQPLVSDAQQLRAENGVLRRGRDELVEAQKLVVEALNKEKTTLIREKGALHESLAELQEQVEKLVAEVKALKSENKALTKTKQSMQTKLTGYARKRGTSSPDALQHSLDAKKAEVLELRQKLEATEASLQRVTSQHDAVGLELSLAAKEIAAENQQLKRYIVMMFAIIKRLLTAVTLGSDKVGEVDQLSIDLDSETPTYPNLTTMCTLEETVYRGSAGRVGEDMLRLADTAAQQKESLANSPFRLIQGNDTTADGNGRIFDRMTLK